MDMKTEDQYKMFHGIVPSNEFIAATILVDEVLKKFADKDDSDKDLVYTTFLETLASMGVNNPFLDKQRFLLAYEGAKQFEPTDWEQAIAMQMYDIKLGVFPVALLDLYADRLEDGPETVLIAEAEKFVPNLHRIIDEHPESNFVLTSQNMNYIMALEHAFEKDENVEIVETSIYQYGFSNDKFDLIFAFPAFGMRNIADDQMFMCRESDMVAVENLSLHLNDGGRLVIILPARVSFASGKINDLRQFIQENYAIKEIAELPEGAVSNTGIRLYLLDIENTRPGDDDITIRRYSAGERKSRRSTVESFEIQDDTFVMLDELEDQGDWNVDRIFSQQDEEYLKFQNSGVRKETISNVADVFRGKSITTKDPNGNISVLNISNIGKYEINYTGMDHIQEEERKVTNFLLKEGDLLLPARGTAIRTAIFHEQDYPCIASSNVIIIRPNEKLLDSTYLKIFLDSPIGNKLISGAQQGMTIMNISYKDLSVLEVPVPPLLEQQEKVKKYHDELKNYQDMICAAETRWNEALTELQNF